MAPTIAVIGSLNTDLVTYIPRIPAAGETATASSFATGLGGKGANQAVACAKLSRRRDLTGHTVDVHMVGAVGDDAHGRAMTAGLAAYGVDASGVVVVPDATTGVAVIVVEEATGDNRIMLSPAANATLRPASFSESFSESFSVLPDADLVVLQLEIPLETVLQIVQTARRKGVPVLLNPAPAQALPAGCYPCIDHLVVNETEAQILSGCSAADLVVADEKDSNDANANTDGLQRVARVFHDRGVGHVFITLGGHGVYYSVASPSSAVSASGLVPAEKARVVDTTAAGDTFVGAYALAVVHAKANNTVLDVEAAVRAANRAAAKTVEKKGAQDSIPWLDEL